MCSSFTKELAHLVVRQSMVQLDSCRHRLRFRQEREPPRSYVKSGLLRYCWLAARLLLSPKQTAIPLLPPPPPPPPIYPPRPLPFKYNGDRRRSVCWWWENSGRMGVAAFDACWWWANWLWCCCCWCCIWCCGRLRAGFGNIMVLMLCWPHIPWRNLRSSSSVSNIMTGNGDPGTNSPAHFTSTR